MCEDKGIKTNNENIINIYKNIHCDRIMLVDKQRSVRLRHGETDFNEACTEWAIPGSGSLFANRHFERLTI